MAVLPTCPTLQNATSYTSPSANVQGQDWQATLTDVQNNAPAQAPKPPVQAQESNQAGTQNSQTEATTALPVETKAASPASKTAPPDATAPDTTKAATKTDQKKSVPTAMPVAPFVVVPPPPVSAPKATGSDNATQAVTAVAAADSSAIPPTTPEDVGKKPLPSTASPASPTEAKPASQHAQAANTKATPAAPVASPRQAATVSTAPSNRHTSPALPAPTSTAASTSQLLVNRIVQSATPTKESPRKILTATKASPNAVTPLGTSFSLGSPTSTAPTSASPALSATPGTDAANNNGAALAATVTALHQAGQTSTIMRLDPPGLGHLSVQVGMTPQGQINVLFVPSSADAAQALQASLTHFNQAIIQSGLALGQSQVGGQFAQSGGQNGQPGQNARVLERQNTIATSSTEAQATTIAGLSAYA